MTAFDWCTLFLDDLQCRGSSSPSVAEFAPGWLIHPLKDDGTGVASARISVRKWKNSGELFRLPLAPEICKVKHCAGYDPGCPLVVCVSDDQNDIGVLWNTRHARTDETLTRVRQFCSAMQRRPAHDLATRLLDCVATQPSVAAGVLFYCVTGNRVSPKLSDDVIRVYESWEELEEDPIAVCMSTPMPDGSLLPPMGINSAELALVAGVDARMPLTVLRGAKTMRLGEVRAAPITWQKLLRFGGMPTNRGCIVAVP